MTQYLLDTNILVAAFDTNSTIEEEYKVAAKERLREILANEDNTLAITSLIRYEALRGVSFTDIARYDALKSALDDLTEFEITREIAELSAQIFRFDHQEKPFHLNKRQFDVVHYATAVCSDLELVSNDTDIAKIKQIHQSISE